MHHAAPASDERRTVVSGTEHTEPPRIVVSRLPLTSAVGLLVDGHNVEDRLIAGAPPC